MNEEKTIDLGVISLVIGSYTKDGEKKPSGMSIGRALKTGDRIWVKMDKSIFHATLYAMAQKMCRDKDEASFACSVFPPRDSERKPRAASGPQSDDDDIPFNGGE